MSTSFTNVTFLEWLEYRASKCLVAGPCSVETEEQILQIALELKNCGAGLLRGGIWKPRTRPSSFEGMGAKALPWLKAAGKAAKMPVATEVACAAHVDECLKSEVDVLWIGSRTTTSPFAVQEIADSLAGVDIPVMVKNPMNPDLELWLGAIERIQRSGVSNVVAIHRGFSTHIKGTYRNRPLWDVAMELRHRLPGVPILCDPSHMAGTRSYVAPLSHMAVAIGFDGLMIESHTNPAIARSDAAQQLTPHQLLKLMRDLEHFDSTGTRPEIVRLTSELDEVEADLAILKLKRQELLESLHVGRQRQENTLKGKTEHVYQATAS